ncbi:hypothetical protein PV416_15850 [Streptomyces ipomoeae]|uniref:hypothetical protein n=1 Tax=Streptomyces ipomoeae TaxID=103232 RepID=UPI0029B6F48E|nr:hypothetical protein [Streptomyces ipomoeae]MDX2822543.1 hypothetical protein [Streptomyces ipomoeae]MDX2875161.1 hypothetical protein [Streptomyces ipomoeae]
MTAMTSSHPAGPSAVGSPVTGSPAAGSPSVGPSVGERVRERVRSGFGLIGPRHGRHALSVEQVDSLALPIGDDGVVIGVDAEGQPAVLGINRPTPYDVALIGGLWTAQVLALRAAATGARVAVETGRAQSWMQMVHAMGGGQNGMAVYDVGRVPPQGASAGSPVLVVRDCGMRPPRGRVVSGPWQSVLTLLPYLSPVAPRLIRQARLVGVQRVSPDEAAELGRTMALPRADVESLPTLADGVTLWCADRDRQYVMTQPTDAEIGLLGTPRRMD